MQFATNKDIKRMTGLTDKQIQYLVTTYGIAEYEAGTGEGRGAVRRYSKRSQIVFLLASKLADYGTKPDKIGFILKLLRPWLDQRKALEKSSAHLVIYERENGRFFKPELILRSEQGISLTAQQLEKYDSFVVIDLAKLFARLEV